MFTNAIKQEKTIRLVRIKKEEINFIDNIIVYLEKPKELMKKYYNP